MKVRELSVTRGVQEDIGWLSGKDVVDKILDLPTKKISEVPSKFESRGLCSGRQHGWEADWAEAQAVEQ